MYLSFLTMGNGPTTIMPHCLVTPGQKTKAWKIELVNFFMCAAHEQKTIWSSIIMHLLRRLLKRLRKCLVKTMSKNLPHGRFFCCWSWLPFFSPTARRPIPGFPAILKTGLFRRGRKPSGRKSYPPQKNATQAKTGGFLGVEKRKSGGRKAGKGQKST